ncbi:hypothetical protein M5K25_006339 [Dendrobium thyrsiflorum]|uniref:Receptor-like serine/threonine-protein kinase n=1 Tax=Dendrobium thyrsiflorum TaxID=117978 RepID=A0ABD0VBM6_DENTH
MLLPFLLLTLLSPSSSSAKSRFYKNSHLSVEDSSSLLISEDKSFTAGFYKVGANAYTFSIWFTNSVDQTVTWTTNRDKPVNGHRSRLTLHLDGSMVLTDIDGTVAWSTTTVASAAAHYASLLDNGNLVIKDLNGGIIWQSFDSPTDTLLPSQPITKNAKLVSAIGRGSPSSGYFEFHFDDNNVLRLKYNGPEVSSVYWPDPDKTVWDCGRTIYNSSRFAVLDAKGEFFSSDHFKFIAADAGKAGIIRRLTLDYDGNLRLYSLDNTTGLWSITWQALLEACQIHGLCGKNGICSSYPRFECLCPPDFEMTDPRNWNLGCKPKFNLSCSMKPEEIEFKYLPYTDFWGFDFNAFNLLSLDECKNRCMSDCNCQGFSYKVGIGHCYPKNILYNGRITPYSDIYIKVSKSVTTINSSRLQLQGTICNATEGALTVGSSPKMLKGSSKKMFWTNLYSFLAAISVVEGLFIAIGWWFVYIKEDDHVLMAEGYKVISNQFKRFSYRELKSATRSFKEELGRGGSGVVYKGVLENGMVVAVKKLEDVSHGEQEFWGEVSVIGRINHMNLVRTCGFCSEDSHRLLVSEFVENGSLDKALFYGNKLLGWKERFQIAVGVARGLAYLHHECLEWVIHCDVKPENVLLDCNYEPKIADFGLAKLLNREVIGSNVSRIRGTRGYIAPEWASNLPITGKIDVYSYGIVLLELVSGSRVSDLVMKGVTEMEISAMKRMCQMLRNSLEMGGESWIGNFIDSRLKGDFDCKQAKRMVKVAISCLEEERNMRPNMEAVVQMLVSGDEEFYSDATESIKFSSFSTQ